MFKNFRNSVSFRLIIITILVLLLLIPIGFIKSLVYERQNLQENAINEISDKWSKSQLVKALVLTIPYEYYTYAYTSKKNKNGNIEQVRELVKSVSYAHFLPNTLNIKSDINTTTRYRAIYEASVYSSVIDISGDFLFSDFDSLGIDRSKFFFDQAFLSFGVSDARGIKERVYVEFDNHKYYFNSSTKYSKISNIYKDALSTDIKIVKKDRYTFSMKLYLNGSKSIYFMPYGRVTNANLSSLWKSPSFNGSFLPDSREIGENGFNAHYKIIDINRNYPQSFTDSSVSQLESKPSSSYDYSSRSYRTQHAHSSFGVDFKVPVDYYTKSNRSVKYALLFVVLTFLIFFLVEIFNKRLIHPFQYILSGLSLVMFFVLLLSFSEYIGFNKAYMVASLATIAVLSMYVSSILKNTKLSLYFSGILAFMYGFIFVLLQLESYTLLIGSIMLFVVLSLIMYISRKIDWYSIA